MNNIHLETFIHIVEAGSFNKAAEELYITSTAVIKQINLLENDVGAQLFERTHRGVRLTEAGKSLYRDAKYIVAYYQEAVRRARSAAAEKSSLIRIGTSPMTPAQILTDLWPRIHEHCSDISFQLVPFENYILDKTKADHLLSLGFKYVTRQMDSKKVYVFIQTKELHTISI